MASPSCATGSAWASACSATSTCSPTATGSSASAARLACAPACRSGSSRVGALLDELFAAGVAATVVVVNGDRLDAQFLGRRLDAALVPELEAAGVDACGEEGEFHTVVTAAPLFATPVALSVAGAVAIDQYRFVEVLDEPSRGCAGATLPADPRAQEAENASGKEPHDPRPRHPTQDLRARRRARARSPRHSRSPPAAAARRARPARRPQPVAITVTDDSGHQVTWPSRPRGSCRSPPRTPRSPSPSAPATSWWPARATTTTLPPPRSCPRSATSPAPSVEKIVSFQPDLVLAAGGIQASLRSKLENLGVKVFVVDPSTFDGVFTDLTNLGKLMGVSTPGDHGRRLHEAARRGDRAEGRRPGASRRSSSRSTASRS